jgi:hypothetical protein
MAVISRLCTNRSCSLVSMIHSVLQTSLDSGDPVRKTAAAPEDTNSIMFRSLLTYRTISIMVLVLTIKKWLLLLRQSHQDETRRHLRSVRGKMRLLTEVFLSRTRSRRIGSLRTTTTRSRRLRSRSVSGRRNSKKLTAILLPKMDMFERKVNT